MKRIMVSLRLIVASFIISGCASTHEATPVTSKLQGDNVVCNNGCVLEWERANFWVNKHSKLKIQNSNNNLIETYNPYKSGQMGFSITKEPLGGNKYRINTNVSKHGSMMELVTGMITTGDVKKIINHYIKTGKDKSAVLQGNIITSPIR